MAPTTDARRFRVLLIDDDATVLQVITASLERGDLPLEIRSTASGYEGCILYGRFRPDLVILDLHMPDLHGTEILRSMKAGAAPTPKVLVVSGAHERGELVRDLGCDGFLGKPFSPDTLLAEVRRLLTGGEERTPEDPLRVLLVEDNEADASLVEALLAEHGSTEFRLTHASRLSAALEALQTREFDVVLLDLSLPDAHGLETVVQVNPSCRDVPIVVMTGLDDEEIALRAVKVGAQDYLVKGQFEPRSLARTLLYAVERNRTLRDLEQAHQREHYMATHDALTGLANRTLFFDHLEQALSYAERYRQIVAVLFLDLDGFKQVNDRLGHAAGDRLLRTVAQRLPGCIRRSDTAARLGGDEFALLLQNLTHPEDAATVAEHVLAEVARPTPVDEQQVEIGTSIGIALYPQDALDAETLVRHADIALYSAKAAGRRDFKFYTAELNQRARHRHDLESGLRRAIDRGELVVHYQPQVDLRQGAIFGAEALVRWNHPDFGLIPPADFIPYAEECGLIGPIVEWVLHAACAERRAWDDARLPPIRLAVNLAVCQLRQRRLAELVAGVLSTHRLLPEELELEITESGILSDARQSLETLHALKELGVRISLDDFGTGQASLSYLRKFPADTIKLDRSYVRHVLTDENDAAIAAAILAMATSLRLETIAEGVETFEQIDFLVRCHCHRVQGFLFSRPLPAPEFAELLRDGGILVPGLVRPQRVAASAARPSSRPEELET